MWPIFILWMFLNRAFAFDQCDEDFCPPSLYQQKVTLDVKEVPVELVGNDFELGCTCRSVPNIYTLCYNSDDGRLRCRKYPKEFRIKTATLILKSTWIEELKYGDFAKLDNVKTFTIDGNQNLTHIDPYIFSNMTNLTFLNLHFNPSLTYLDPNTFAGLDNLKELDLVGNGFKTMKSVTIALKPNILPNLYKLHMNKIVFTNISEDDFEVMTGSPLVELNMILCGIKYIHQNSLKPFRNLSALRIGGNLFDSDILYNLLKKSVDNGIDLKLLDLYSSGFRGVVPQKILEIIANSNISSLSLERNQFDLLDEKLFSIPMPKLLFLDLTDVSAQNIESRSFAQLPNLRTLILRRNSLSYFPSSEFVPNLTYLDIGENKNSDGTEFFITRSKLYRMKLQLVDLEGTRLLLLTKSDFVKLPYLRKLILKNCNIIKIESYTFSALAKLEYLNLEKNSLFKDWIGFDKDIFNGLENLRELLLGENNIVSLTAPDSGYIFKHLINLRYLSLARNSIQTISHEEFDILTNLKVLDLSSNNLLSWEDRVFLHHSLDTFYGSRNKLTFFSSAMLDDFQNLSKIEVNQNSFICSCFIRKKMGTNESNMEKMASLLNNHSTLLCLHSNETLTNFFGSILDSTLECDIINLVAIIVPIVVISSIIVVLGIFVYIYRWHIRYWAFLVRIYLTRKGKIKRTSSKGYTNHQYDAFVSYCNQDQNFIVKLVKMLENYEPYLKLCVYERDFQVGSVISESVLEHISKSRKTLLVVSNSYAKSYWCNWETQIAEHHRLFFESPHGECVDESIVVIKLGSVKETSLNPTLKYLLKTRIYLQWENDEEKQKVFWHKLRQFLTPPNISTISEDIIL